MSGASSPSRYQGVTPEQLEAALEDPRTRWQTESQSQIDAATGEAAVVRQQLETARELLAQQDRMLQAQLLQQQQIAHLSAQQQTNHQQAEAATATAAAQWANAARERSQSPGSDRARSDVGERDELRSITDIRLLEKLENPVVQILVGPNGPLDSKQAWASSGSTL